VEEEGKDGTGPEGRDGRGGKGKGEKGGRSGRRRVPGVTPSKNPRSATDLSYQLSLDDK